VYRVYSANLLLALCGSWALPWFRKSNIFGEVSLAPRRTPNLEDQGLHFVWPLLFDLSDMDDAPTSISISVIGVPKPPLHGKAIVLEESVV
jgi:hypothetical protein